MASINRRDEEAGRSFGKANTKKRAVSSKYDVHKVKVWLGDQRDHYYILSRFLISRSLTITKIPSTKAVKIALELKKHLVDHDKLNVSQAELEETLFSLMRAKGYGQPYIDCYRTVSAFYTLRQPLIIIVCGAPCTGKSTIAQQLAARLNMPNVMQTDVICELLRCNPAGALPAQPPWMRGQPPPAGAAADQHCGGGGGIADVGGGADAAAGTASSAQNGRDACARGGSARAASGPDGAGGTQPGASPSSAAQPLPPPLPPLAQAGDLDSGGGSAGGDARRRGGLQSGRDPPQASASSLSFPLQPPSASGASNAWLLGQFRRECGIVRKALEGDFNKALNDGKPLIVEGAHLDPGQLLAELQELGIVLLPLEPGPTTPGSSQAADVTSPQQQQQLQAFPQADAAEPKLPAPDAVAAAAAPASDSVSCSGRGGGSGRSLEHAAPFVGGAVGGERGTVSPTARGRCGGSPTGAPIASTESAGMAAAVPPSHSSSSRHAHALTLGVAAAAGQQQSGHVGSPPSPDAQAYRAPPPAGPSQQQEAAARARQLHKHVSWGHLGPAALRADDDDERKEEERQEEEHGGVLHGSRPPSESAAQASGPARAEGSPGGSGGSGGEEGQRRLGPAPGSCALETRTGIGTEGVAGAARDAVGSSLRAVQAVPEPRGTTGEASGAGASGSGGGRGSGKAARDGHGASHAGRAAPDAGSSPDALTQGPDPRLPAEPVGPGRGPAAAGAAEERLSSSGLLQRALEEHGSGPGAAEAHAAGRASASQADTPEPGRCASSPRAESSPRTSVAGGGGGDADSRDGPVSDVDNYGDADTDGEGHDSGGGMSPLRTSTAAAAALRHQAAAAAPLDTSMALLRRAQSHPVMPRPEEGDGDDDGQFIDDGGDAVGVAYDGAAADAADATTNMAAAGASTSAAGAAEHQPGSKRVPPSLPIGGAYAGAAAAAAAAAAAGEASPRSFSVGSPSAAARLLDRTRSQNARLFGAGPGPPSSRTTPQLTTSASASFGRIGSWTTLDLHHVKSSLAGILRMGSAAHGSRLSPSPRMARGTFGGFGPGLASPAVTSPGGAGASAGGRCGAAAASGAGGAASPTPAPPSLLRAFSAAANLTEQQADELQPQLRQQRHQRQQQQQHRVEEDKLDRGEQQAGAGGVLPAISAASRSAESGVPLVAEASQAAAAAASQPRPAEQAAEAAGGATSPSAPLPAAPSAHAAAAATAAAAAPSGDGGGQDGGAGSGGGGGGGGGPSLPALFVPVVLRMDEADHRLALEDNMIMYGGNGGGLWAAAGGGGGCERHEDDSELDPEEVLRRAQAIQHYLCSFEGQGLPVVTVQYGNFGEALDILHEYVLMCIQAAMEQLSEGHSGDAGAARAGAS